MKRFKEHGTTCFEPLPPLRSDQYFSVYVTSIPGQLSLLLSVGWERRTRHSDARTRKQVETWAGIFLSVASKTSHCFWVQLWHEATAIGEGDLYYLGTFSLDLWKLTSLSCHGCVSDSWTLKVSYILAKMMTLCWLSIGRASADSVYPLVGSVFSET